MVRQLTHTNGAVRVSGIEVAHGEAKFACENDSHSKDVFIVFVFGDFGSEADFDDKPHRTFPVGLLEKSFEESLEHLLAGGIRHPDKRAFEADLKTQAV